GERREHRLVENAAPFLWRDDRGGEIDRAVRASVGLAPRRVAGRRRRERTCLDGCTRSLGPFLLARTPLFTRRLRSDDARERTRDRTLRRRLRCRADRLGRRLRGRRLRRGGLRRRGLRRGGL